MHQEDRIKQIFYDYETAGLVERDAEKVISFLDDHIMGFGMGEQGFISSKKDVAKIMAHTVKKDPSAACQLEFEDVHVHMLTEDSANLCAKVFLKQNDDGKVSVSGFMQSLSFVRRDQTWLICALHASPIMLSKESIESYPMLLTDHTLSQLRSELQEEGFQFLSKSLSIGILGAYADQEDLPPFYINDCFINMLGYSRDELFQFLATDSFAPVHPEDRARVHKEIHEALAAGSEYACQYRLLTKSGDILWIVEHGKLSIQEDRNICLAAYVDITELMKLQLAIKEKNDMILSSITYASRIQKNLLPSEEKFRQAFSDYSILWSPKDIVGGDIYWMKTFQTGAVVCVCDCTGHGIPGALLTVLISTSLENIVNENNCHDTAEILYRLDQRGAELLCSNYIAKSSVLEIRDGCDAAVLFISQNGSVTFSSSNMPVFVCDGQHVKQYKGKRLRIGEGRLTAPETIPRICLPADQGSVYYVASDGLFDQIGGTHSRPFGRQVFQNLILKYHLEKQELISQKIWEAFEMHRGAELRRDDVELISFCP